MNEHKELSRAIELRISLQNHINEIDKRIEELEEIVNPLSDKLLKNQLTKVSEKDLCYLWLFCYSNITDDDSPTFQELDIDYVVKEFKRREGKSDILFDFGPMIKYFNEILDSIKQ